MSTLSTIMSNPQPLPVSSLPNPNAQQNRVPGNTDITVLRRTLDYNTKAIRTLDEEIKQLQKTYETIHNRHLKQQPKPEATQSGLDRIRSFIDASEAQRALHESERRHLLALMLPVCWCSDEILHEIFAWIIRDTTPVEKPLRQAFHLSSVCQKWRTVAVNMPLLWERFRFNLSKPTEVLKHQHQTLVSRTKGRAVDIFIMNLKRGSEMRLNACGLKMFPSIGNLVFVLASPAGARPLLQSVSLLPAGCVRKMRIQCRNPSGLSTTQPLVVGSSLLGQFPGLTSASIHHMPTSIFQLTDINSTLTELMIYDTQQVSIATILRYCLKLDTLKIGHTTLQDSSTPVVSMSLRSLELTKTQGDTWMPYTSLPKLDTLVLRIDNTPASLAFISSNRSITKLLCSNLLSEIADIAPQLIELHVSPPLHVLCASTSTSQSALSSLSDLFADIRLSDHDITVEEFDMFVRTRCLPFGHPRSLTGHSYPSLSRLTLTLIQTRDPAPQEWEQSKLYKESTRSEFTHPFYRESHMRLTWPVI
ncbi:hypothetical protein M408DRAFT_264185 [Serendipita vermifera MAFF 305830]|uniref:Uncharacterized protein n=1 Tax=Serendipita vermifera MAFF 305830 TaxID=933852 RepID=A0A0C2X1B1_SERVB|nr:hypothetical protein M408DRAFT_264185 [Serendipita vermifera MAFF 305830]